MELLFPLLRFRNKYLYCLGIRRSVRNGCWILFSIIFAMTAGILIVCFTLTRPKHPCHFGLKRVMKSSIVSSSRPRSVAVGDFNNDHHLDIVVANSGTNTIGVFLSQGDGVFGEQQIYLTDPDSHPCSVAVGYLNSDNYVDIAVANYAINNISIFLGNGDGTFTDPRQFSTGSAHPLYVTTGDVNNDNATDLIVVNYGTNSIGIHLGYGNGLFQNHTSYSTEFDSDPRSVTLGDFNNDKYLDIAVANYGTSNIGILLGYGNGTFASQKTYSTLSNSHPSSLALADLNYDDQLDIVVSNNGSGTVGMFLGRGDGSFEVQRIFSLDLHSHPEYITVADMNEDNQIDGIIVDSINDRVHILLGDGNGSFATITTYDGVLESSPKSVGVGNFNNNDQSDIAVVNYGTNNILVLMDHRIKPSTRQVNYMTGELATFALAVGDFNSDRIPDIVYNIGRNIFILNGLDNKNFDKRAISTNSSSAAFIQHLCIGDVNNDSWLDIVTANLLDDSVGVLLGRGNETFDSMTSYSAGRDSLPSWVALGDVDADGRIDIVCTNYHSSNVGILLGNGDGTFATIKTCFIISGSSPRSVALGDINHDHRLDIVVVDENGYVYVFIGYNNGTCIPAIRYRASVYTSAIALADFNSDNNLDIVVTNTLDCSVGVFLGYGNGTFIPKTIYPVDNAARLYNVIVADFNNDHIPDLATPVFTNNEVVIFYGNGNGSFILARRYSTGSGSKPYGIAVVPSDHNKQLKIVVTLWGTGGAAVLTEYTAAEFVEHVVCSTGSTAQPFSVAAGDFTHDNRSDVVVVNSGTDNLGVLVGSDNGTFEREIMYRMGADSQPQYVITCDIDQDQQLDIVSVNSKLNSITVMMGQNNGTFADETMYSIGSGSHPSAVTSGDLNNDGWLDLVVANEGTDSINVFFGFGYTTFQKPTIYSSDDSIQPAGLVVCDFNNDGFQDIATAFYMSNKIGIYLGCDNSSFILAITYSIGKGTKPWAITASDLNNDGRADIVVGNIGTNEIGILLGYGNGTFATVTKYPSMGPYPASVAVGDMNNDDRLDLVVANYYNSSVGILYGYGDGTFSTMELYHTKQDFRPVSIVLCDLNNDSRLDAVMLNSFLNINEVVIKYGTGAARDQMVSPTITSSQPQLIIVADFNNDNQLDIASAHYNDGTVGIVLNDRDDTFTNMMNYPTGFASTPSSLVTSDFNNDKILDIVVVSFDTSNIVVLSGIGDGTFLVGKPFSNDGAFNLFGLGVGDFNNDTRLDIVVTNYNGNNMVVFPGGNSEPFGSSKTYATGDGSRPHSVAVGDLNNDHQMDIVVANYGTDNVGVLLGLSDRKFASVQTYPTGTGSAPYSVGVADFNKDNYLDIVVTTSETDNIVVLLGNGSGTVVINATYSTGYRSRPYTLVISDFNNDHMWDIAVANSGTSQLFLIYGTENGTFGNETSYSLGYGYHPYSIAATDLNSDGWMDVVVACFDTDHIEIFIQMC